MSRRDFVREMEWVDLSPYEDSVAEYFEEIVKKKSLGKVWFTEDANYIGKLGECTLHALYGMPVEFDVYTGNDGGFDVVSAGKKVDVKTRELRSCREDPYLLHTPGMSWPDRFALVVVDAEELAGTYVGYADASEMRNARMRNFGHGKRYALHWTSLN